jgi:hypothetical protein
VHASSAWALLYVPSALQSSNVCPSPPEAGIPFKCELHDLAPHEEQLKPNEPHDELVCDPYGSHVPVVPPAQQPPEQVTASHEQVPFVVSHTALLHDTHAAPPVPHCPADSDA